MRLRGINFNSVFDASGVRGFFGNGYDWHELWRPLGLDFTGSTFVAKTTTLEPRKGNMLTDADGDPIEDFPDCIIVKPLRGVVLNAVGLSGPGAEALFMANRWQQRTEPFFLSFMSVGSNKDERIRELREFCKMLYSYLPEFNAPVGLQINFSCPNTGVIYDFGGSFVDEIVRSLRIVSDLGIPWIPKFSVLFPVQVIKAINDKFWLEAICVSNTIPWWNLPEKINWLKLFLSAHVFDEGKSPFEKLGYGKGGLSGKPLLPLVCEWIRNVRKEGFQLPIVGGGGIMHPKHVTNVLFAGADAVSIGSVAILRPWRVRKIIRYAKKMTCIFKTFQTRRPK